MAKKNKEEKHECCCEEGKEECENNEKCECEGCDCDKEEKSEWKDNVNFGIDVFSQQ